MASPFAITAEPDVLAAITARLRTFTEITALTSTRISGEIGPSWFTGAARQAIVVRRAGGPVIADRRSIGQAFARLDLTCYGESTVKAIDVMNLVLAALCPRQGQVGSFSQTVGSSAVRVYDVFPNAEVATGREPDTGYRFAYVPIVVDWSTVAA